MITVDGRKMQWQPGMTFDQVMASLEEGDIYAVARLNGKLVSRPYFSSTLVEDGAFIECIPLVAGG